MTAPKKLTSAEIDKVLNIVFVEPLAPKPLAARVAASAFALRKRAIKVSYVRLSIPEVLAVAGLLEEAAQVLTPKPSAVFLSQQEQRRNCDHKTRAWPGAACPTCGDGLPD